MVSKLSKLSKEVDMNTDNGQRLTALLMAAGGLKTRDIAEAMRVSDEQVKTWLQQSSRPRYEESEPRRR